MGGILMNNYEKIKSMTIEQMAQFIETIEDYCKICAFSEARCKAGLKNWGHSKCYQGHLNWLEEEADE